MRVVEAAEDGVALCSTGDGAQSEVMLDLVGARRRRRRGARTCRASRWRGSREVRRRVPGPGARARLARRIVATVEPGRDYKIMEVCGGHTHAIYRYGVQDYLPEYVELVHGPGCPVCVIPMGRIDDATRSPRPTPR